MLLRTCGMCLRASHHSLVCLSVCGGEGRVVVVVLHACISVIGCAWLHVVWQCGREERGRRACYSKEVGHPL